jgi:hypothetical protein
MEARTELAKMRNASDSDQQYGIQELRMSPNVRGIPKLAYLAYVVFSLIAIAYLPKFIPTQPNASDSYQFGYNNQVGVVLILGLVGVAVLWSKGLNLQYLPSRKSPAVSNVTLLLALLAVFCGCVFMYMFAGHHSGFGESFYLIDRAWLLIHGKMPYREIEFAYGPGLLYGPLIFKYLLPIDIAQAYYLFWLCNCLLGTFLLFKAVNLVDYPTEAKESIFLLLFLAGLFGILRMGTNYTFLRFSCPIFFVLVFQKQFKDSGKWSRIRAVLISVALTATLILISPEIAIAHAFACLCICLFSRKDSWLQRGSTIVALLVSIAFVFAAALKLHILDTLLADGGGAISFPILIAPHIVVFFAALFVCTCYVFQRLRDPQIDDNTFGLIAFSIPMLAAALGRCDPSHVYWNGLAIFLASMCYVSHYKRAWQLYCVVFVLFSFLLPDLMEFHLFGESIKQVNSFNANLNGLSERQSFEKLFPSWRGDFLAPLGYRPGGVGLYDSSRIDFGRFEELTDVSAPRSVAEKVAEMRENPERALLLPVHYEGACLFNPHEERHFISFLFLVPYKGRIAHSLSVRQPICDFIRSSYRIEQEPNERTFWYGLWVPKVPKQ